jgi:hypothetical protein
MFLWKNKLMGGNLSVRVPVGWRYIQNSSFLLPGPIQTRSIKIPTQTEKADLMMQSRRYKPMVAAESRQQV